MGATGCVWVCIGALGVQGAWGDIKTSQEEQKMVVQGIFPAIWSEKFPLTSRFSGSGAYEFSWVWGDTYGFFWMHWGAGTRVE